MAMGDPYGDLPEFKDRMQIHDSEDDARAERALLSASRNVEKYCRRQFNVADPDTATARLFRCDNSEYAIIADFHSTTGLTVELGDLENDFSTTWVLNTDFWVSPLNGVRNEVPGTVYWRIEPMGGGRIPCPSGRQPNLRVAAPWGWGSVPEDVIEATYIDAHRIFRRKDSPDGVIGGFEGQPIRVGWKMDPDFERLLKDYRKHVPGQL